MQQVLTIRYAINSYEKQLWEKDYLSKEIFLSLYTLVTIFVHWAENVLQKLYAIIRISLIFNT